jgi:hypothetical protein
VLNNCWFSVFLRCRSRFGWVLGIDATRSVITSTRLPAAALGPIRRIMIVHYFRVPRTKEPLRVRTAGVGATPSLDGWQESTHLRHSIADRQRPDRSESVVAGSGRSLVTPICPAADIDPRMEANDVNIPT